MASWTAQSDDPTYLAQLEPILEGLRKAGVPEYLAPVAAPGHLPGHILVNARLGVASSKEKRSPATKSATRWAKACRPVHKRKGRTNNEAAET